MKINLFNIPNQIIDTSKFNNLLHGDIVEEFESNFLHGELLQNKALERRF